MLSREQELFELENTIGYAFRNRELLRTSLRHKSALEGKNGICNDKLEWFGDRVVGLFIADYLFQHYEKPRSWLSATIERWASAECLAQIARRINLGRYVELGRGEKKNGGPTKDSILTGTLEALIGAVFLDSHSYSATRAVLLDMIARGGGLEGTFLSVNFKELLQKWCLKSAKCLPEYIVVETVGDGEIPYYQVAVKVSGRVVAAGEGKNKKKAEQNAAENALEKLIYAPSDPDNHQCD
ncbi:MAG TPA: ribonuclease III [Atribacteraceae bacterium]|nr:ribonuclease III [Atribacteraceae bacterium]